MSDRDFTLSKITYEFYQEGNTSGTTSQDEILTVEVESSHACISKEGGFLVIRTETGWSINDSSELVELLSVVEKGVTSKKD